MALKSERKQALADQFRKHPRDLGSTAVQIANLTERIASLSTHFEKHVRDHHSRRGLTNLVSQRRKLLDYLARTDEATYRKVLQDLGIRK